AVYAIVNGNQSGWTSAQTLGLLGAAVAVFALFVVIESRVAAPLMPLRLLRLRNLVTANGVGILWAAAMFAWFFLSALYLQLVLHYRPLEVGLAFLPANLIMGTLSIAVSAKLVMRFGIKRPLAAGLGFAASPFSRASRPPGRAASSRPATARSRRSSAATTSRSWRAHSSLSPGLCSARRSSASGWRAHKPKNLALPRSPDTRRQTPCA